MTTDNLELAAGFNGHDEAPWRAAIDKILKGADFDKRLVSKTADGIALQPLYKQAADATPLASAHTGHPWQLAQRVDHPDPQAANRFALDDLANGAGTLVLVSADSFTARGFGASALTPDTLDIIFADVALEMIGVRLEAGPSAVDAAKAFAAFASKRGVKPAETSIAFNLAPLTDFMTAGILASDWPATATTLATAVKDLTGQGFAGPFISCDARPVSEAGGSEAQELAVAIAAAVEYLRALEANGVTLTDAAAAISFTLPIDAAQFEGVAKLRALRKLWSRVRHASSLADEPVHIHAETAWRMATRRDPGVNMLRTTMATFIAGIGGADSLTVLPYTLASGLPDGFARRIARNTQSILTEESNLFRVTDPAAGSGAIEALTDELCRAAWAIFQDVEREGGLVASLNKASIQDRIAATAAERAKRLATRREPLTGTSEFPQIEEPKSGGLLAIEPQPRIAVTGGALVITPLSSHRLSEAYEALRDAADAHAAKPGARPSVFLANLGPIAEHNARALWITNLLAAGGIAVMTNDGFTASADVGKAFADSGATVACICSNDANYETLGEAAAMALRTAGATHVMLAGRPGDNEMGLRAAGVDEFLHVGVDVLASLGGLHEKLGIKA